MRSLKTSQSRSSSSSDSQFVEQTTSNHTKTTSKNRPMRKKPEHKCLQNNLVYASSLPLWFQDEKVIRKEKYFGQYGNIISVISTIVNASKTGSGDEQQVQSYITYDNLKDAAIAIAAVNDIYSDGTLIRSTYGTTRFCEKYMKGERCTLKNCYYMHDQKRVIRLQSPYKLDFEKQRLIAYELVKKNLAYYISKIESSKEKEKNGKQEKSQWAVYFPSVKQAINKLLQKNVITKYAYLKAYEEYLSTKKKMSETVKQIQYVRYRIKSNTEVKPLVQRPNRIASSNQQKQKIITKTKPIWIQKRKRIQKSQFLMSNIIQSLDENDDNPPKRKAPSNSASNKNWQSLVIFGNLQNCKQFWQQELIETDESESGSKETPNSPQLQCNSSTQVMAPFNMEDSFVEQDSEEELMLLNKIKEQISKTRWVKASILQFTQPMPYYQKEAEYQKVTNILKSKLMG